MTGTPEPGFLSRSAGPAAGDGAGVSAPTMEQLCVLLAARLGEPLGQVVAFIEQSIRRASPGAHRAELEAIQHEALRCRGMLDRLRALQRDSVFQREPVEAGALFARVTAALRDRAHRSNAGWREAVEPDAPEVAGDPGRLQLALEALAENALDAVAEYRGTGRVLIAAATAPGGRLALSVSDDGPGMSPAQIDRAADPFVSTKPGRLGVGLTLARTIVSEHHGELDIRSTLGSGTTVTLTLPAWRKRLPARVHSPRPAAATGRRVLLAFNDPEAVDLLAEACDRLGWRYHVAVTADDAALLAARGGYDAAMVATGLLAGDAAAADVVERQRGLQGRVIRVQLPDGPPAPGAVPMPDSPDAVAVALGLALAGQAGPGAW